MSRPFIAAPNCASVEMIYAINGVTCENIFHVQKASPYSGGDLTALRTICDNWDNATQKGVRASGAVLNRIRTKALDSVGSAVEDYNLPVPRAGTNASLAMPGNVTFALKLATGLSGRSFRGRIYVVGLAVNIVGTTPNQIALASSNALVSAWETLRTNLLAGGSKLIVLSYRSNKQWRLAALPTQVTNVVALDLNLDSMRRRLTGRGI